MFSRLIGSLTLMTTLCLMGDVAQILCFGEDGHAALERFAGAEHLGSATQVDHAVTRGHDASVEGAHVDVSVSEAGPKNQQLAAMVPVTTLDYLPAVAESPTTARAVLAIEAPTLRAVRTTVLRT